jgi:hypothetical protein
MLYFYIFLLIILFFSFHFIVEKIIILSFFILLLLFFNTLKNLLEESYNERIIFFNSELKNYFDLYLLLYKYIKEYYLKLFLIINNFILFINNSFKFFYNYNIYYLLNILYYKNFKFNLSFNNLNIYKI